MRSRNDEIRKRIEKRKRERERIIKNIENRNLWVDDEERYGFQKMEHIEGVENIKEHQEHPLFKKEWFLFKILASGCLVLFTAIIFRNHSETVKPAREFVIQTMNEDFQFATVSNWYEQKFGKPLAFLPTSTNKKENRSESNDEPYALPASGRILENFSKNGQRITIETGKGATVDAMNEGFVSFIGEKDGFGKTVIIQHSDNSESWYGNLADINVHLYAYIDKGVKVGNVTNDGSKGSFYFAIKKGDNFIDPIQVIQFE
ncbi:M23 family metallopeptidase [Bacillus sp. 03113]|uniref:M23 family metallopeptidase n=1 Tax=Bacillus sp. 03113 TaxID=2578211 RepID=UPI001144EDF6|nr:M23 family metallopeptidase [Bacillus sp. 03113]